MVLPTIFVGRTDCGSDEVSHVTVPATISVHYKMLYQQPPKSKMLSHQLLQPIMPTTRMAHQLQPIKPKAPRLGQHPNSATVHPYIQSLTMLSSLQFFQPCDNVATVLSSNSKWRSITPAVAAQLSQGSISEPMSHQCNF